MRRKNRAYGDSSEMYPLIELYEESGLSQRRFCEQMEIAPHRFRYWLKKYRQTHKDLPCGTHAESFVSLEVENTAKKSSYIRYVRITLPEGTLLEYPIL